MGQHAQSKYRKKYGTECDAYCTLRVLIVLLAIAAVFGMQL